MGGVRLIVGPGLTISLLPLLLLFFAVVISTKQQQPARMGAGPFDGTHCHLGESLVPPAQSSGGHTHNDK